MSPYRFLLTIEVDDEALDAHDGNQASPPNEVEEWDARDIFRAAELGIVNPSESDASFDEEVG